MAEEAKLIEPTSAGNMKTKTVSVEVDVPLPASDWARLCALAASRQVGRGELAAYLLGRALRHVVIVERGTEPEDSPETSG